MISSWFPRKSLRVRTASVVILMISAVVMTSPAFALVKVFDGFGDADLDNNGIPLEPADVDVSSSGDGTVGPYVALGNGGSPLVYPMDTMVDEVTAVENASDTGIRWYSIGGWTSGTTPDPRAAVGILSDAAGALPEANPSIGYNHSMADSPGTRYSEAIDDGLALAFDSKGRGNAAAGFFNNRVELGPEVGDEVRVNFDFRLWFSASAINTNTGINEIPAIGEIRFGMYQDTDNQLGQTNAVAAVDSTSAVWGQENGNFRGDAGSVGASGDHGWFVRLPIDDSQNSSFDQLPAESIGRINEETNEGSASDLRILNGSTDFVAAAPVGFPFMDVNKVYNLSLSLKRYDDPATEGSQGDTIFATVTVTERSSGTQWSFSGFDPVTNPTTLLPDGISSDSWDYFVMSTAGQSTSDDFDWLIDNFTVEAFGSNAVGLPGDYNNDGFVNAADYTVWRNHLGDSDETSLNNNGDGGDVGPSDYTFWKQHFGDSNPGAGGGGLGSNAVPEPGTLVMLLTLVSACGFWRSHWER